MKFIALIVFIIVQIIFIPMAVIGLVLITAKQLLISKKLGVSSTALSAMGGRWIMNAYGIRKMIIPPDFIAPFLTVLSWGCGCFFFRAICAIK